MPRPGANPGPRPTTRGPNKDAQPSVGHRPNGVDPTENTSRDGARASVYDLRNRGLRKCVIGVNLRVDRG